jgi:hypothetical protein
MNRKVKVLRMFAAAGLVLLCAAGILRAQANRPGDTMQLWEYHTEIVRSPGPGTMDSRPGGAMRGAGADAMLNARGSDGWELVALARREIRVDDAMHTETLYAFKRLTRVVNR